MTRIEGQAAFEAILRPILNPKLGTLALVWRANIGLRGLTALPTTF
jgi:hypothetical protein